MLKKFLITTNCVIAWMNHNLFDHCNELHFYVFPSPHPVHMLKPYPAIWWCLEVEPLWIKFGWGHGGGGRATMVDWCPYKGIKKPKLLLSPPYMSKSEEGSHQNLTTGTPWSQTPWPPEQWKTKVCYVSHLVYGIPLRAAWID